MSGYDFEAASHAALFFGLGDWYFMTDQQRQKLHAEKLALPSFGQQVEEAKVRLAQRKRGRPSATGKLNAPSGAF
jgi:hypothetical protein